MTGNVTLLIWVLHYILLCALLDNLLKNRHLLCYIYNIEMIYSKYNKRRLDANVVWNQNKKDAEMKVSGKRYLRNLSPGNKGNDVPSFFFLKIQAVFCGHFMQVNFPPQRCYIFIIKYLSMVRQESRAWLTLEHKLTNRWDRKGKIN